MLRFLFSLPFLALRPFFGYIYCPREILFFCSQNKVQYWKFFDNMLIFFHWMLNCSFKTLPMPWVFCFQAIVVVFYLNLFLPIMEDNFYHLLIFHICRPFSRLKMTIKRRMKCLLHKMILYFVSDLDQHLLSDWLISHFIYILIIQI